MSSVQVGAVLQDRYELTAELGKGGMGTVYRALDPLLDRPVAIKVLAAAGLGTEGRARLLREARAIARLGHPNIVAVHDVGEFEEIPYVVMELVEGKDLHQAPPAGLPQIVAIAAQICAALEHAHQHRIVHRDLKPENVLVEASGTAKLVDFGIARSMASRLTSEGVITGSVYYLAPELALGQEFDGRCDLYALGVMLYELCTGTLPFTGSDPLMVISQHVHATPVAPQAKNEAIPPRLDDLILRLLSKRPEDRPESAAAVRLALQDPQLLEAGAIVDRELAVLRRVARGHFVGRQRELRQARSIWTQAQQGQGQALLISGEPGIGKSRLTRELATQAEISGGRVLVGECYPEGGLPYGPFAQILRRALRWTNGNGSGLPDFVLADLLSLAPDLRPYYPQVGENPALDPEGQQQRLFESVATFLSRLAEQAPLLLALEDVHWADSGSLALFRHLARRVREKRAMVVATYREVELGESRPLQEMLVELNRERLADRLKLGRFDREATGDLLAAIFEEQITPEFLEGIYAETEGNPFFVEELCKALVEEGKLYFENGRWHRPAMEQLQLPQSVRVAIESRLGKLPESVLEVLRMAAVLGHDFDFETLSAALEAEEDTLIAALEAAERSQLIEETATERGGTFRFAHALIASTLAEALSGLRRRRMHAQAAQAILGLRPEDYETLAYHFGESGDLKQALDYSLRAGRRAMGLSAYSEALQHLSRGLEIAEAQGLTEERIQVLESIGDVQSGRDFNRSVAAYRGALELNPAAARRAVLKAKIGTINALSGEAGGLPLLEEAIAELDPTTQANELAQAIASLGRYHHNHGQHKQAIEHLQRARQLAETDQGPGALLYTYTYLAGAYQHLAQFQQSLEWARRAIAFGEQTNLLTLTSTGHEYHAENFAFMGHWEEALKHARVDRGIGEKTGLLDRIAWGGLSIMWACRGLGRLAEAVESGRQSLEMAEASGDRRLAVLAAAELANAMADMGHPDEAAELARRAVELATQLHQAYITCMAFDAQAYLCWLRGDWAAALEARQRIAAAAADTDNRLIPMVNDPALAEVYLELGQPERALETLRLALQIAGESDSPIPQARALHARARIRFALGEADRGTADFRRAVEICERWKSRLLQAQVLLNWGRLQIEGEPPPAGRRTLQGALDLFAQCGAQHWVGQTRAALQEEAQRGQGPAH